MKTYSSVQFHSKGSSDLDGKQGVILGIASAHTENNFWIVKLDQALLFEPKLSLWYKLKNIFCKPS